MPPANTVSTTSENWLELGKEYLVAKQHLAALNCFDEALLQRPEWTEIEGPRFEAAWKSLYDSVNSSDWRRYDDLQRLVTSQILLGKAFVGETTLASPYMDGAVQLSAARNYCQVYAQAPRAFTHQRPGKRVRLGFVGGDFHQQATAYLLTGVIERIDRGRFELLAYDFGPDYGSHLRKRNEKAYDHLIPIHGLSDQQSAQRIHADRIDVLFHMRGIANGRLGIFALRPCPIQIHYLYYPGTSGAACMDYIIADDFVIPPAQEVHYAEQVLRIPGCYQPNDDRRPLPSARSRAEFGLPADAVVLGNFSQSYKLTPDIFGAWCRLLWADPKRLLWLLGADPVVHANLRREAAGRGLAPDRLVFSPPMSTEDHLARLRACDLVIDTFPYGGHTLTSDALWAGVPVVTLAGDTFASRVAGSLLRAVGLQQLVTRQLADYLSVADALLRQPASRRQIREKLEAGRAHFELFQPARYARKFETLLNDVIARHWPASTAAT